MAVKGKTNNPHGRPKGVPNKATGNLRKAISDLLDNNWERIQSDLDALEPKDRLVFIEKLLSYSLPKLSAIAQETTLISKLESMGSDELLRIVDKVINEHENESNTI